VAAGGRSVEILDLRTLVALDEELIYRGTRKSAAFICHKIAAGIAEHLIEALDAPIIRVARRIPSSLRHSFRLFIKENLHRHCRWAAQRVQPTTNALFIVLDHGRERLLIGFAIAVTGPDLLRSSAVQDRLDRNEFQTILRTDVDAAVAQHAFIRVIDDLNVALEATLGLPHGFRFAERPLHLGDAGSAPRVGTGRSGSVFRNPACVSCAPATGPCPSRTGYPGLPSGISNWSPSRP
jgi:hypothetical protein